MQIQLPSPIVRGRASSSYTPELIERRLSELRERHDAESLREIEYLERLKNRQ